jgi:hypothetical protein
MLLLAFIKMGLLIPNSSRIRTTQNVQMFLYKQLLSLQGQTDVGWNIDAGTLLAKKFNYN